MGHGRQGQRVALLVLACTAVAGCNRKVLEVLVDLPPSETPPAPAVLAVPNGAMAAFPPLYIEPADTVVPEIEKTLDPDSVVAMLPRDHAGNIDWSAALKREIIRPREGIGGPRTPRTSGSDFGFDFYFPGPNEMFDAYFPHSAHVEWLSCSQCHPRIFKTRPVEIQMADVFAGRYCGECHGTVAYPVMTGCERCHTSLPQPPDRAEPELIGTIVMSRATEILARAAADSAAAVGGATAPIEQGDSAAAADGDSVAAAAPPANRPRVDMSSLPVSQFPHWVHRIRYRCKTCHMEIFEPSAGSNAITMVDIDNGEACGQCHDGRTAFAPQMDNCDRCHVPPTSAPATPEPEGGRPEP